LTGIRLKVVVLLALAAAAALGGYLLRPSDRERLVTAYGELPERPLALRLSGFPAPPARGTARGKLDTATAQVFRLRSVGSAILSDPEAADQHTLAIARLLDQRIDEAVASVEEELERNPRDAALWNDLAAALFERAVRDDDPQTLVATLAALDNALALGPMPEAAWNRGRVLEQLALDRLAADAYRQSLATGTESGVAAEARERLRHLERRTTATEVWASVQKRMELDASRGALAGVPDIVNQFPGETRAWAETEYLASWGEAALTGDEMRAKQWLELVRAIGEPLALRFGESMLIESVHAIDGAGGSTRRQLAAAHVAYRDARRANRDRNVTTAAARLDEAIRMFGDSPMRLLARCFRASAAFDLSETAGALAAADAIAVEAKSSYVALRGEVAWLRATIAARRGRTEESLRHLQSAAVLFDRIGDSRSARRMRSDATITLAALGRSAEAWRLRGDVFRDVSAGGDAELLRQTLSAAAQAERRDQRWANACSLYDLQLSIPGGSPRLRFNALLQRGFTGMRAPVRRGEAAPGALEATAREIPEPALRQDSLDDAQLAEAVLGRERDPRRALTLLDATIASRRAQNRPQRLPEAYVERARTWLQMNDRHAAMLDYEAAVDQIEASASSFVQSDLRDSFIGSVEAAFEELADLLAEQGENDRALALIDRSRARLLGGGGAAPIRPPAGAAIATYTVCEDHVLLLVATQAGVRSERLPASSAALGRAIRGFTKAIRERDETRTRTLGRWLFHRLVEPVLRGEPSTRVLIVVPDRELANLPFAVLTTRNGRYLIEEFELTIGLSASSRRFGGVPLAKSAMLVGDPAFDAAFDLPRLPAAAREVRTIARGYSAAKQLTGEMATMEAVLRALPAADVIHFATHALGSPTDARRDALLLAGDRLLTAGDIASLRLVRAPLAVLAGCSTASAGRNAGTLHSLTAAFLAAGSRGVVGALWPVDDAETAGFSIAFHQRLTRGQNARAALRETQRDLIARGAGPSVWGGFQLYGWGE
jgi:CHAT domain-containing protein